MTFFEWLFGRNAERAEYDFKTEIMTLQYKTEPKIVQYHGECTVWYKMPDYIRCGTMTEAWLCDIWTKFDHERRMKNK